MIEALSDENKKMLQFILSKKRTTYGELAVYLDKSKKTVAKYVNELRDVMKGTGTDIVVKQNKGIYLQGNPEKLWNFLVNCSTNHSNSKEDRVMSVYSKFLTTSHYLKVQELADELYVSRSTLENTLKKVKKDFSEQGFKIDSSRDGMILKANENQKRYLMSGLINYFWGNVTYLDDNEENLTSLLQMTPEIKNILNMDTLHRVMSVVNDFSWKSKLVITDYEYKSLVIHLTIALDRIKEDKLLKLPGNEAQLLENTVTLVELIEQEFAVTIPLFEKEYMNNHVLAIERNERNNLSNEKVNVGTNLKLEQVLLQGLRSMDADDELFNSLALHLGAAVKRLQLSLSIQNPYTKNIKLSFPRAFDSAVTLTPIIEDSYDVQLNDDEIAYIALHFEAFFERRPDTKRRKDVLLVCSSGLGTSKLLEQRVKYNFSHALNVTRVLSLRGLKESDISEDFIISTVPIDDMEVPVVVVSPLLDSSDLDSIKRKVSDLQPTESLRTAFFNNLEDDMLFVNHVNNDSKINTLSIICNCLLQKKCANNGVLENALRREEISSTAMGIFAIPHAEMDYITQPRISIYVNKNGIYWDGEIVYIIFFFALNDKVKSTINQIYEYFNNLISDEEVLKKMSQVNDKDEIVQLLKRV